MKTNKIQVNAGGITSDMTKEDIALDVKNLTTVDFNDNKYIEGPASSTDDNLATFDLATGKLIQDSGINISAVTANTSKVGVTDGDKGDITVSATGATWTVDNLAITSPKIANNTVGNTKLAQVATDTIKGRTAAGTGNVTDLTPAEVRTMINVADGATVDQDLSGLALKSNVLELDNTSVFIPDADYEPATKLYVDSMSDRESIKCLTVESPTTADVIPMFNTHDTQIEVDEVFGFAVGGTSISCIIRYGSVPTAGGGTILASGTLVTAANGSNLSVYDSSPLPTGVWVWYDGDTNTGGVTQVSLSLAYNGTTVI